MEQTPPRLETARLILSGHNRSDFSDSAAMWADPAVVRYIGGKPSTREESWSRFLRFIGLWPILGFGYWVVRERKTGAFIGEVGFADFKRDLVPSFDGAPEMGWVLAPGTHGRGYATEAVQAALSWADRELRPERNVCVISPENVPSLKVAARCGFRELTRSTYRNDPIIVFERRP